MASAQPKRTVVCGQVRNADVNEKTIGLALNRVGFGQEALEMPIGKDGNFHFTFEAYEALDLWVSYKTNFLVVAYPGDSIHIVFDGTTDSRTEILKGISISGSRTELNRQVSSFQAAYFQWESTRDESKVEKAIKERNTDQFKLFADSIRKSADKFYKSWVKKYKPGNEAKLWAKAFLDNDYFTELTFYPDSHRKALVLKKSEWDVPLSYYNYFKTYESQQAALISAYATSGISNKYLYRYAGLQVKEKLKQLTITKSVAIVTDSLYISTINALTTNSLLKQILLTQYFSDLLEESDTESFERYSRTIDSGITLPFLREPLLKKFNKLKATLLASGALDKKQVGPHALVSKISSVQELVSKHQGKPLYIDVWATWCGPCLEEFPYSKMLREELKDVTFVYICIDSEYNRFQNTAAKFGLEGDLYFLDNNESKQLRQEFGINGIPHYILVNPKGEIVFEGFKLRPSEEGTAVEIRRLLGR
ncbi:cytochrome c biogenesis protein [Cytophagales bacterium WSM2-2]|nr:cytochrome c biogenesis protein [Cytophagales bacterium WSM2-2]